MGSFFNMPPLIPDDENSPHWRFVNFLQQLFDPNYGAVQMEMLKQRKPDLKTYNDSTPRSLEDIMSSDPRMIGYMATQYKQSLDLLNDLGLPPTAQDEDSHVMSFLRRRAQNQYLNKIKPGM